MPILVGIDNPSQVDTGRPTVVLTADKTRVTDSAPFTVTIKFNEPVTGFAMADISVTNAALSAFTADDAKMVFTVSVIPKIAGDVKVAVAANVATDLSNNKNAASNELRVSNSISLAQPVTITALDLSSLINKPVQGAAQFTTAIDATQYSSGAISWFESDGTTAVVGNFAAAKVYIAKLTLTAKTGYTLTGVGANLFTYVGATSVVNAANSGNITIVFAITDAVTVNVTAVAGVTVPVAGATPVTTITETAQYTGTVSWFPVAGTFVGATNYTATVTLTPKTGFTFAGVGVNFFAVSGATATNVANTGVVSIVFATTVTPVENHFADGVAFKVIYVPAATFPTGADNAGIQTVADPFWIGKTEVTYELWYKVRTWAIDSARGANIYTFQYAGMEGSVTGGGTDPDYTNIGKAPTAAKNEPVTMVSWRDTVVWCNALSEMLSKNPVYRTAGGVIIRSSAFGGGGTVDAAVATTNNGFRLPTEWEWELAARWKNDSSSTDGSILNNGRYWTPGDYASGATAYYRDAAASKLAAWYNPNSGSKTQNVGSKPAAGNHLGVHDMSGNVVEWCWGSSGSRPIRGRGWSDFAVTLAARDNYFPYGALNYIGFRVVRP